MACRISVEGAIPKVLGISRAAIARAARFFAEMSSRRVKVPFREVTVVIQDDKGSAEAFRVAHWGRSCLPCRRHIREGWKDPLCRGRRATPGYLPGTLHEPRSLAGYHPWGLKESDVTEHTQTHTHGNEVDQPDRVTW